MRGTESSAKTPSAVPTCHSDLMQGSELLRLKEGRPIAEFWMSSPVMPEAPVPPSAPVKPVGPVTPIPGMTQYPGSCENNCMLVTIAAQFFRANLDF